MFKKIGALFILVLLASFLPVRIKGQEEERVGVGVGTGKIILNEELKPGTRYSLPLISVVNTGNVEAEYQLQVTFHENQSEKRPAEEWFSFIPQSFTLKPGEVKQVEINLTLPFRTEPGDYFAYLEAHPTKKVGADGETSIGIAAATKLNFSVVSANIFQAIYYRTISLYREYQSVVLFIIVALGVSVAVGILRRFVDFDIKMKNKE